MPQLSETSISLLTILNNINDLIVLSSARKEADDVMRALSVYAKNKSFPLPEDKIENFHFILLDSKPYTITSLLHDIARDIIITDNKIQKDKKPV